MRLIITRHGETTANKNKILQGQLEGILSELGIEQAKKVALRLKDEKIDIIYTSDLGRALDTTKEIAEYHKNTPVKIDKRLRERFLGEQQGKLIPKGWNWVDFPDDVETDIELTKRAKEFLDEIYEKHKNQTVLLSTHGGIKLAFLTIIHNRPISDFNTWEKDIKNTALTIVEIKEDKNHEIHLLNCIKHLEN